MQALLYALIQAVHNIGAVAIVGIGAYGLFYAPISLRRLLAAVQAFAWAIQGITGGAFGLTTFHYYHQLPDIHGTAIAALLIKIACVVLGFIFAASYLVFCTRFSKTVEKMYWWPMFLFGLIALISAAFLRWFS